MQHDQPFMIETNRQRMEGTPRSFVTRYAYTSLLAWLVVVGAEVANSLAAETESDPSAVNMEFFEKSIRPLLVKHCYECHSTRDANGGLALDSRDGVLKGGDSGAAIIPGDPDKSRLIEAVRYKNPDLQMPPKNRLSAAEVAAVGEVDLPGRARSSTSDGHATFHCADRHEHRGWTQFLVLQTDHESAHSCGQKSRLGADPD